MKWIATIAAAAAAMLAGAAPAQAPAQTQAPRPAPRPPAQAPAQTAAPRPAAPAVPQVPTRVSARTLTNLCGQDRNGCLAYGLGSADAFAGALVASGRPQVFCVPRGTTNDQIAQAVVRYLRAHPEEAGNNAAVVVLAGLRASFPCGY